MSVLRQAAGEIARRLISEGYQCYFAGGCVRDRLLGEEPHDIDIATSARPDEVMGLFPGCSFAVGAHFGVVLVRWGGFQFDVATFRKDGKYHDGRHPDHVEFSGAQEDAQRRDFTVNGLFEDPVTGEVVDYVGGLVDLKAGLIRAIGKPEKRFEEDALRLIRGVRFAVVKGFEVERGTWRAMVECAGMLGRVSVERIREEFDKILLSPNRRRGVEMLVDTGMMRDVIPEVYPMIGCEQPPDFHPEGDVYTHTMMMLGLLKPDAGISLALAVLLHDVGKPPTARVDEAGRIRFFGHATVGAEMCGDILKRLRYPNKVVDSIVRLVGRHMDFMNVTKMRPATLRRFISVPGFEDELELHRVDCMSSHRLTDHYEFVRTELERLDDGPSLPEPLVNGKDLIEMGYQPGPVFAKVLHDLTDRQIEGKLSSRKEALEEAARLFRELEA